jgi:hypothetical protein
MNAKIIEGLKAVRDGIDLIIANADVEVNATPAETLVTKVKNVPAVEEKETPVESAVGEVTREQLDGMTYNNLKKFAKDRGISAVGNRDDITARLLGESVEDAVSSETTEEAPTEKKTRKLGKKSAPEVEEPEKETDPVYAKVLEAVKDMSNEEIADVLADIGISAKGKREALIDKVTQAVRDGLLDLDDDESEEDEAPVETPTSKTSKKEAPVEEDEEEEDNINDFENPDMTEARKKAIIAQDKEARDQFSKKKLTRKDCVEFLQQFYDTEDSMEDMNDDDLLDTYIDAVCRLIDDDGDLTEEGAYELNGQPACCGRILSYSEDTKMFVCEHCGEEYEADEE